MLHISFFVFVLVPTSTELKGLAGSWWTPFLRQRLATCRILWAVGESTTAHPPDSQQVIRS